MSTKRDREEADEDDVELDWDKGDALYSNIKVLYDSGFDIIKFTDKIRVPLKDYLVVLHKYGKERVWHWHVVCIMDTEKIEKKQAHLYYSYNHPLKVGGKKPVSKKNILGDRGYFAYVLKPKEYADEDCVIATNIDEEEIKFLAAQSAKYHFSKKADPDTIIGQTEAYDGESFYNYLLRITQIHYQHNLVLGVSWGPSTLEGLVAAICRKYPQYIRDVAEAKIRQYRCLKE
jgi:hypothetical protein